MAGIEKCNVGQEVEFAGGIYRVVDVYEVTDDKMKEYNLKYKQRAKLVKVSGEGLGEMDVAVTGKK